MKNIHEMVTDTFKDCEIGKVYSKVEVVDQVVQKYGCNPASVIPSDYCYNRINDGINFETCIHIFEYIGRDSYKYLGENYQFTGGIFHKPKGGIEVLVGEWVNGEVKFDNSAEFLATGANHMIKKYQKKCFAEYKSSLGLDNTYTYLYGNPINVLVPIETAVNGYMIVGAYPSAKFFTVEGIPDVPLYDNDSPFSSESYFDGSRVRSIPSGVELEQNYLAPLGISRSECWITDLVKVFLFKEGHVNRYKRLGAEIAENRSRFKEYAEKSLAWLEEEVRVANPKVVLLLGAEVTSVLFNTSEAKAKAFLDGRVRTLNLGDRETSVICLPHPGIVMKTSVRNPWPQRFREEIIPRVIAELAET